MGTPGSVLRRYFSYPVSYKILAAFFIAIPIGWVLGEYAGPLKYLGDIFIRLIKFVMVIIVFTLVASTISNIRVKGTVVGAGVASGIFFYILTSIIAALLAVLAGTSLKVGAGMEFKEVEVTEEISPPTIGSIISSYIPDNPITPFSQFAVVQVLIIAAIVGAAVLAMRRSNKTKEQGEFLAKLLDASVELAYKILRGVLEYAPFGIFGLTAYVIGKYRVAVLGEMGKYTLVLFMIIVIQLFVIYPILLSILRVSPIKFYKNSWEAFITAFSTRSSAATLPVTMNCAERLGIREWLYSLLLPLGATINMDGSAIYIALTATLAAQAAGMLLAPWQIVIIIILATLLAAGLAPVPGAGGIVTPVVCMAIGAPIEPVFVVAPLFYLYDPMVTANNVIGDLVGAALSNRVVDILEKRGRAVKE